MSIDWTAELAEHERLIALYQAKEAGRAGPGEKETPAPPHTSRSQPSASSQRRVVADLPKPQGVAPAPAPSALSDEEEAVEWVRKLYRHGAGKMPPDESAALKKSLRYQDGLKNEINRIDVRREAEAIIETRGMPPRERVSARDYAKRPAPDPIIDEVLGVGINLLSGPSEAGKSLFVRDLMLSVASGYSWRGRTVPRARQCLYLASEGLHDFAVRWETQPLWEHAADRIDVQETMIDLRSGADVDWLYGEYDGSDLGLIAIDLIYDAGLADDNSVQDVGPALTAMQKIANHFKAAVLAVGHTKHGDERRFRGSSMWRQRALVEWHMANGLLSCEKSKLTDKSKQSAPYAVDYPNLTWLGHGGAAMVAMGGDGDLAERDDIIRSAILARPDAKTIDIARSLVPVLHGLSLDHIRRLVARVRKTL